jgi:probable selenium-dependent hydroxylase accessory protein YqeC
LINFVGGGGKTGLILRLMDEVCETGPVIFTTTTRIHPPHPHDGMVIISCNNPNLLKIILERTGRTCINRICKFVATRQSSGPRFLQGVDPAFGKALDRELFRFIFNEADGARSMSLKMPREGEPVLMEGAEYLVPVIGIDCLMRQLGPETLFRWELVSERFSSQVGQLITPRMAAEILLHPEGVCRDWKPGMRIVPYINKADDQCQDPLARELALALLHNPHFPVECAVWGSLLCGRVNSLTSRIQ